MKHFALGPANLPKIAGSLLLMFALCGASIVGASAAKIRHFRVLNAQDVFPVAINASGTIMGLCSGEQCAKNGGEAIFIRTQKGIETIFSISGASAINPEAMNDEGQVVGDFNSEHGFLRNPDGTVQQIDVTGAVETYASAINDSGVVVGAYAVENDGAYYWHGFIRAVDGTITTFDPPRATESWPSAINSSGVIAGYFTKENQRFPTTVYLRAQDGTYKTFAIKGATGIYDGVWLNDRGEAAGTAENDSGSYGFLRSVDGKVKTIEVNGDSETFIEGLNDRGDLIGVAGGDFLRTSNGTITEFNVGKKDGDFGEPQ